MANNMTIYEYLVLVKAEKLYIELRTDIVSKRAEMVGKLKKLGFSIGKLYIDDSRIPREVRAWLVRYQQHLVASENLQRLREELTGSGTSSHSNGKASHATPAPSVTARTLNFGETSDNPVYNSTMLDYMVCVECEKQYYKLRTQLVSQRAEILGKLKKLGFGLDTLYKDDTRMPPEAHTWLQNYEKHLDWREKIDEMRARLFGPSQQGASEQRGEGPAHAASQTDTMRSRTERTSDASAAPLAVPSANEGGKKKVK